MATIKASTDLEQSRKLAKILPLESADMGWNVFVDKTIRILPINDWDLVKDGSGNVKFYHAWSLAALLGVLPYPYIEQNYKGKWICRVEHENTTYLWEDSNPIDACVAMVEKLHELNLL